MDTRLKGSCGTLGLKPDSNNISYTPTVRVRLSPVEAVVVVWPWGDPDDGLELIAVRGGVLHIVPHLEGGLNLVAVRGGVFHVVAHLESSLDLIVVHEGLELLKQGLSFLDGGLEGGLDLVVELEGVVQGVVQGAVQGGLEGGPAGAGSCWWLAGPAGTDLLSSRSWEVELTGPGLLPVCPQGTGSEKQAGAG